MIRYLWHSGWPDGLYRYEEPNRPLKPRASSFNPKAIGDATAIDDAITALKAGRATTLIIQPSPLTYQYRAQIIATATQHRGEPSGPSRLQPERGGTIAYGPDYIHMYRRAPLCVERVIRGTKPADLPVELPSKVELLVNLKSAKALGLEVPLSLLVRADECRLLVDERLATKSGILRLVGRTFHEAAEVSQVDGYRCAHAAFCVGSIRHANLSRRLFNRGTPIADTSGYGKALIRGLEKRGYVLGRNLEFERRGAGGRFDILPNLLAELVASKVDVIVAFGYPGFYRQDMSNAAGRRTLDR